MNIGEALKVTCSELESITSQDKINFNGTRELAEEGFRKILAAMFPMHMNHEGDPISHNLGLASKNLCRSIAKVVEDKTKAEGYVAELISTLPSIRNKLQTDILAAYQGDPAARNLDEIILAYPAFTAISAYRVAHELFKLKVPLIPRIITEYAHRLTGIDIHPGATIGEYFFIDHGTGVVIGETSTIGDRVKIYQNVTIGAKSFDVAPDGSLVKGIKRHPDIGNDVVIYAGATILGGSTRIGDNCVIGGNVWLTHSVNAGEVVVNDR